MNYPLILVEVPHQTAPRVHVVYDETDLAELAHQAASDDFDLLENEDGYLDAIGRDLHTIHVLESAEDARRFLTLDPQQNQNILRAAKPVYEAAELLGWIGEIEPPGEAVCAEATLSATSDRS